ncbi:MAG TPA: hypothetical protein VL084_08440 [Thermoanaerobaculia bacterium]|nr:hypothetical protein [Thermoanaerobaculia bacterium]
MTLRSTTLLAIAVGGILVLFVGFTIVMSQLGLFTFTGTDPSSKVVAAALALVGTFVGAVVSIVGVVLKYSIDQQTESRQQIESRRTAALQLEAEQRLKLEAAVRALQLFSTSSGSLTPDIQRDGALFMLANFGQHELTLQLVDTLLSTGQLSAGVASSVIDQAIRRGDETVKAQAISVLENNAARLVTGSDAGLPQCLADWIPGLPDYVREWALIAMAKMMLARSVSEWTANSLYQAYAVIAAFGIAWTEEKVPRLKMDAGAILHQLLTAFPNSGALLHPRMTIDTNLIRAAVANLSPQDGAATEVVQRLAEWSHSTDASAPKKTSAD